MTDVFDDLSLDHRKPRRCHAGLLGEGSAVPAGADDHGHDVVNMGCNQSTQIRPLDCRTATYGFRVAHQQPQHLVLARHWPHGRVLDIGHKRSEWSTRNDQTLKADLRVRHFGRFRM